MKKLLFILSLIMIIGCSKDILTSETQTADIKVQLPPIENANPMFFDDGRDYETKLKEFNKYVSKVNAERKARGETGKPQRSVYLKPSIQNTLRTYNGRILEEPIEYLGDIIGLDQTIDFDNDGLLDEVTVNQSCYFPRTFLEVLVNGEVVSYSVSYFAEIIGFKDVNLDGFTDVVFKGGSANAWNHGEAYRPYNVAYNVAGTAIPLKDIIQSLVIDTTDPNPEFIKWDLSEFGIHNFVFHVYLYNENLSDGFGYEQTTTYGEFGFYSLNRITVGETYILSFTNLDDCKPIIVKFKM